MEKIRYKYRPAKRGIELNNVVCPVCENPINWIKPVGNYEFAGRVILLAECWSGSTEIEDPRHLFLIMINGLPRVEIN